MPEPRRALRARLQRLPLIGPLAREAGKFGTIGLISFVVDTVLYNLLVFGLPGADGGGPMHDIPLRGKIVATSVAIVVGWIGNRYWTWRHRRSDNARREFVLFFVFAGFGMGIALLCLGFSRYVLDLHSQLADNVAANGVGLVLGTLFRFWAYRTFVFTTDRQDEATVESPTGSPAAPDQRTGAIET